MGNSEIQSFAMNHSQFNPPASFNQIDPEQLPIPDHELHGWKHFAGIYAGEHVAATEFVIGATFVALGATTRDILIGLLIGNLLAVLSWTFITAPIAVQTRLSLYWYLKKIAGESATKLYNWANVLIFTVISAAMITVSSSAVRFLFKIPAQLNWYPADLRFILVVLGVGIVVVLVAIYGFNTLAEFSTTCAPWLFVMFVGGAMALLPALTEAVLGKTQLANWKDFIKIADHSIWTGINAQGNKGVGMLEVLGFAWAANTLTHVGLIDMAIFRYAKKTSYGLFSSFGMLFGHYIAWIAAGIMGAGTAVILNTTIIQLDPGDVAYYALGASGFVIVIIAGWTTANTNLYRAGLAAQAIFQKQSRKRVTLVVGIVTIITACFPFVFTKFLPLLAYAGLIVVPVGAIVFTEHFIFPVIGLTRYWVHYKKLSHSIPAITAWMGALIFGFGLDVLDIMSFYHLFIPTWFFTVLLYTLLARYFGAREQFKDEAAREEKLKADISEYQKKKAEEQKVRTTGSSVIPLILDVIAWGGLMIILVLAVISMFGSTNTLTYESNKATFHRIGFICTVIYFVFAYLAFRMRKKLTR